MTNKKEFCNYPERASWARRWINSKNKILITKRFCERFPERYDYSTWHGRTVARNCLVVWANKYNKGTLRYKVSKGNWVPKKKIKVKDLDPNDIDVYQEIVEAILENNNISKDEIIKEIIKRKEKTKNQKNMSGVFDFTHKIYYRKTKKNPTRTKEDIAPVYKVILNFKKGLNRNLGYEATYNKLISKGLIDPAAVSIWSVRRACEELEIMSNRVGRKSTKPKEKKDTKNIKPNLIKGLEITKPNQVWSTDVSYLKVKGGFVYLSAVIDLFSKKLLGYAISGSNNNKLVMDSILQAIKIYGVPQIIHSDNGYQYTSKVYTELTAKLGIKVSKSYPGRSLENREIEFWFGLLKRESLYKYKNQNISTIIGLTDEYIRWYNEERIKKGNGNILAWLTPKEVHAYYSR